MQQLTGTAASEDPISALLQAFPCGCLLLRDSLAASGHFLLPWITTAALQQRHKVVFVAAAYLPSKHKAVLRKIGAPGLSTAAAADGSSSSSGSSIAFVSPAVTEPAFAGAIQSSGFEQTPQQQEQQQLPRLQQLYQQVVAAARQLLLQQQQQQHLTVIVDSLTVLTSLVCDDQQAGAFMHYLMALGELLQVPCRIILLAATDVPADGHLLAAAAARAHVIADVAPLEGRTAAVDGSLTVTVRQAAKHRLAQQQQQQQQQQVPGWLYPGCSSVWFFRAGDVVVKWLPQVHGKELMA